MVTKILFVYNNAFGQYPILYEYCVNLCAEGFEVHYIGVSSTQEEFVSPEGIRVHHIAKKDAGSSWKLSSLINRHARQLHPSIIHVFHFRWCFLLPLKSAFFTNYILDVRTLHVANKKGEYSPFTFLKNLITWMESQFFGHCIALTDDIRRMLQPSFKKIPIVPLGANLTKLQPTDKQQRRNENRRRTGATDADLVFIYSGTLSPARKINDLLLAFSSIGSKNIRLVIAGDDKDDPQTLAGLKELSKKLGIKEALLFTGFILYDELVDYYLGADVGLCWVPQTSYYDLQPPTKLFEYLAAGLVTVATNTTANKNIISDGSNGYLSDDHPDAFRHTLVKVISQYHRTSPEMILRGHEKVQDYAWSYIIRQYIVPYYHMILHKSVDKK